MKLYLKLLLIISLCLSCKDDNKKYLEIKIRGIENCIQIIKLDEYGNGVFMRGQTKDNYRNGLHKIDIIELSVNFFIKEKEVLDFLKSNINELNSIEKKKYSFLLGGQRYILDINGKEIVDSYGSKSNEIHEILKKIQIFLPEKLIYNC